MSVKRIYDVVYEEKWTYSPEWIESNLKVLSNGDARSAVEKAKRYSLKQTFFDDEKNRMERVRKFRLLSVDVEATADI